MGGVPVGRTVDFEFARYVCQCGEITTIQGERGTSRSSFIHCSCGSKAIPEEQYKANELEKTIEHYLTIS